MDEATHWRYVEATEAWGFWVFEATGARPGPALSLIGGQHGMEPAGPGLLAEFVHGLDLSRLRGTLRVVPMAFVEALRGGRECAFPEPTLKQAAAVSMKWGMCPWHLNRSTCGRNLNRLWPGVADGSPHERLVHALWQTIGEPAEYIIDFHCWADYGPPGILIYDEAGLAFSRQFLLTHHYECGLKDPPGILTYAAAQAGKTSFTVELAPQNRISQEAAAQFRRGLANVLRFLKMLPGKPEPLPEQLAISWAHDQPVSITLDFDAIVVPAVEGGAWREAGEAIGTAYGLDNPSRAEPIVAPIAGIVSSTLERSVVTAGQPVVGFWPARKL